MTEVLVVLIPALAGIIIEVVRRSSNSTQKAIEALRKENDSQHHESKTKIEKLEATATDTNTKVAVIQTDIKHISKQVDRNSRYIDQRRAAHARDERTANGSK